MKTRVAIAAVLLAMPICCWAGFVKDLEPTVYVLAVGIDRYADWPGAAAKKLANLSYSKADASALVAALEEANSGRVKKHVLLDSEATLQGIQTAFEDIIRNAVPSDIFVFYFAGNEVQDTKGEGNEPGLLPYGDGNVSAKQMKAWVTKVQARFQVIILDTCNADRTLHVLKARLASGSNTELEASGRRLLMLGPQGLALEYPQLKHGAFTYAILQGLSGEADLNSDGYITAHELEAYLHPKMFSLGSELRFTSYQEGDDFRLGQTKKPLAAQQKSPAGSPSVAADRGADRQSVTAKAAPARPRNVNRHDYALLIATNMYDYWKPLVNPIPDAEALAGTLRDYYGFETDVRKNLSKREIVNALQEYRKKEYGDSDQLLIFIAGHGTYDEEIRTGYTVTKTSKPDAEDPDRETYISHDEMQKYVDNIPAKHIMLVMDVCYGGTFDRRIAESGNRGEDENYRRISLAELLQRKTGLTTRKLLTSGEKSYVPDGVPGHHSPFAAGFLGALEKYGGSRGYLSFNAVTAALEDVKPGPHRGEISHRDDPGSEFLFISKEAKADLAKSSALTQ